MTGTLDPHHLNNAKIKETKDELQSHDAFNADYQAIEELEADFDSLLFNVMGLGGPHAIAESLRQTRRLLYGDFVGNGV
jgi:hypothetical protein